MTGGIDIIPLLGGCFEQPCYDGFMVISYSLTNLNLLGSQD